MPYERVLALIDTELALLEQVRQLLISPTPSRQKIQGRKAAMRNGAPAEPLLQQEAQAPAPAETLAPPVPVKVPARISRGRRSVRPSSSTRTAQPATRSALMSSVPAGPVFVRAQEAKAQESKNATLFQPPAPTAEQLAQKWLRSASN